MVRNTTKTDRQKANAQWRAVWALLDEAARRAISSFCLDADRDIAAAALKIASV